MYETVKMLHSYWAYLVLLILVFAAINALLKLFGNKEFHDKDLRLTLFALIVSHIQFLLGLVLLFVSPFFTSAKQMGMGSVMKDAEMRNLIVEHPVTMLLAIILITMGYSKHKKKETSKAKFKIVSIYYTIALVLVLAKVPWKTWI